MVSGKALSTQTKQLIYDHHTDVNHPRSAEYIYTNVFLSNNSIISLSYLEKMCNLFDSNDDVRNWNLINSEYCKDKHRKRKSKFSDAFRLEFNTFERKHYRLKNPALVKAFNLNWFGEANPVGGVKLSTAKRWIRDNRISRKKVERRHIRRDPVQQMHQMRAVEHIQGYRFVDTDAMCTAPKTMEEEYARSPIGEVCEVHQIEIGDRTFSLIASACYLGILAHFIKEDSPVDSEDIVNYMDNILAPKLMPNAFGLIDNAKVHKSPRALLAIERAFNGNYIFSAPYSPHLKPIERIFKLVRDYLKENEDFAIANPIAALTNAMEKYSINGPDGHKCKEFFALYDRNYDIAHL
jgi:transposase